MHHREGQLWYSGSSGVYVKRIREIYRSFSIIHVDDSVVYILPELLYPLQDGDTPLHLAAMGGHTSCMKSLLSIPDIDVNIKNQVCLSTEICSRF